MNQKFLIEGRGDTMHTADEIKSLHQQGDLSINTRLSRDGKQWFASGRVIKRTPQRKGAPRAPLRRDTEWPASSSCRRR